MKMRHSFPLRVLAISFLVLALPLLVDSFLFFKKSYEEWIEDDEQELRERATYKLLSLSEVIPVTHKVLFEMEELLGLGTTQLDLASPELTKQLTEMVKKTDNFEVYFVDMGKDNVYTLINSTKPEEIGFTFTYKHPPPKGKEGIGTFWRYWHDRKTGAYTPFIHLEKLIRSKETGEPLGRMVVTAEVQEELSSLLDEPEETQNQEIFFAIVNNEGIVFDATNPQLMGNYLAPLSAARRAEIEKSEAYGSNLQLPEKPLPVVWEGGGTPYFQFVFDEKVYIGYMKTLPDLNISLLAYSSKDEIFGKSVRHFLFIYTMYALVLIAGGAITFWLTLFISKPFNQLQEVMGKVKEGDLNVRFSPMRLGFEINLLGGIFNHTLDTLLETMQKGEDERVARETYQKELQIGQKVQSNLFPEVPPQIRDIELAALYLPALEVGGDFFDVIVKESRLYVVMADTAGKGVSACLYSLGVRSLLRSQTSLTDSLEHILRCSNELFCEDTGESGTFATVWMGALDFETKELTYHAAGHLPGLLLKPDGRVIELGMEGIALGVDPQASFTSQKVTLERGDLLLLYTDGVASVRPLVESRKWESAQAIVDGIKEGRKVAEDEFSLLALRVL